MKLVRRRGRPPGPSKRQHPGKKLNAETVTAIRASKLAAPALARFFKVSTATIYHIKARTTWKHVP